MSVAPQAQEQVPLLIIVKEWSRLGATGFGGPPTHISMLRSLCVDQREWLSEHDFEDAIATTNLLPGPASTQLAIYCAWRLRGPLGAILGGICFIVPGLILILALSVLFLAKHPPSWVLGAATGAGAAIPAVALSASWALVPGSRTRMGERQAERVRWLIYALAGASIAAFSGTFLVLVIIACGVLEILIRRGGQRWKPQSLASLSPLVFFPALVVGGIGALAWVALKVGALSYGGGFVIVPLMQHDAVTTYHWMTNTQFLSAVALGQITPGPVVQTIAVVGYAAGGIAGGVLAAAIAFAPSFIFILAGAPHFEQIRANNGVRSFLIGAGAAVIGAIAGSAIPLGLSFSHLWQIPILVAAGLWLFLARRSVVSVLLLAGAVGIIVALSGVPV